VEELTCEEPVIAASEIRIIDQAYPEFPIDNGRGIPITVLNGDICDQDLLTEGFRNASAVFHLAAIVDWGTHEKEEVLRVNRDGTETVVKACKKSGVGVLVHVSSEDAVYTGTGLCDIDENQPYPRRFPNAYCRSKAESEQLVLGACGGGLKAAVIRPGGIYGEADPYHVSSLIAMAEKRRYVRIGDGTARCQHVYAGNVAHALLLAALALAGEGGKVDGGIYFITDSPPENFFGFLDTLVEGSGYEIVPRSVYIPKSLMFLAGCLAEAAVFLIRPVKKINPKVSRFTVWYTCSDFTFSSRKAEEDFAYRPKYSRREAFERTTAYFKKKKEEKDNAVTKFGQSKRGV
jgi:sterol-4alpha-carboxylate 3-dehydrogenase (decarboxylating)